MPDMTLLIVEDHDILREGLQLLLETEGFRVMTASHGRDALQKMEIMVPDLILSDILMPVMNGYEFYDAVRRHPEWLPIPFIFLTARGDRDDLFTSKKLGVEDYLVKPIERHDLVSTIRSRLERSQQLMLNQLQHAYEASLIVLANAIELRDHYTRGHVERVRDLSILIAKQMGQSENQINVLRFGAILHDIGKIYIRENLLRKCGPLNDEEWAEMKRHPEIGADLLGRIPYLIEARPIIHYHHERWDGKGYPIGLRMKEIPLEARIVAVADSYDAMTTHRVYHTAISPEDAINEIRVNSGLRYDPDVVDAFLLVIDKHRQESSQIENES